MFTLVAIESHEEEEAVHDAAVGVERATGHDHLATSPAH
jgi:hypothetical protein